MKKQPIPGSLRLWQLVVFLIAPVLCALVCLCIGRMNVPVRDLVSLLLGREVGAQARAVLWSMRLPRVLLAAFCSAVTKLFGKKGVFYKVCGHEVDGIDGLIDYDISFKEYVDYGILNPENPSGVCDEIYEKTGVKAMIIDASDIDCVILGKCRNVTLTDEQLCEIVRDNPAGQEGQCTPFILIRKKA